MDRMFTMAHRSFTRCRVAVDLSRVATSIRGDRNLCTPGFAGLST
jgi:hypothetical protein